MTDRRGILEVAPPAVSWANSADISIQSVRLTAADSVPRNEFRWLRLLSLGSKRLFTVAFILRSFSEMPSFDTCINNLIHVCTTSHLGSVDALVQLKNQATPEKNNVAI